MLRGAAGAPGKGDIIQPQRLKDLLFCHSLPQQTSTGTNRFHLLERDLPFWLRRNKRALLWGRRLRDGASGCAATGAEDYQYGKTKKPFHNFIESTLHPSISGKRPAAAGKRTIVRVYALLNEVKSPMPSSSVLLSAAGLATLNIWKGVLSEKSEPQPRAVITTMYMWCCSTLGLSVMLGSAGRTQNASPINHVFTSE
jgi:hypothetical protein